jgi:hypothetical protein
MRRGGWTIHEMVISMTVLGGVIAIAAHVAAGHLRLFRDLGESVALRRHVGQTGAIVAAFLSHASPHAGDLVAASDSALELHAPIGSAFACSSDPGRVVIPAADGRSGNVLTSFFEPPQPGDRIHVLFEDSTGATWLAFHVATVATPAVGCVQFPSVAGVWLLELREPVVIPGGAPLRFTRPVRLSLYRGSDSRWYLGARDWNGETGRFNTVQPVAGPLRPYSTNPDSSGLLFTYHDSLGVQLDPGIAALGSIASVTITTRAVGVRRSDDATIAVAFRNAR